jgi:spore coat-associated protein N
MSRLGFIKRHPKRALSGLATLMVASGMVVGSGAYFQSTDTNNGSSVSAGTIALQAFGGEDNAGSNGRDYDARNCAPREASQPQQVTAGGNFDGCYGSVNNGSEPFASVRNGAIFEISNLEPGQVVQKNMRLKNVGTLDSNTFLKLVNKTDNDLFNALEIRIDNVTQGNSNVYQGKLNGLDDAWFAADGGDPLSQDQNHEYRFMVKLPETGADQSNLMGTSTSMQFQWVGRDQGAPSPNTTAP